MELRFILVSNCNFNCYFCLNEYYGSKETSYSLIPNNYNQISESAKAWGIKKVTVTGGEPTLRKDIKEILQNINVFFNDVTLITNGVLIDRKIEIFSLVNEVHVSFHSFIDNEWKRITRNKAAYRKIVEDNIILLRKTYPKLVIKLNVVSEKGNNSHEEILKYIDFAQKYSLEINLFQDGYYKMLELLGMQNKKLAKPSTWWDLSFLENKIISSSLRKKTYNVENVIIHESYTSSDLNSWDSIWVSPKGGAYCDILQSSKTIDLKEIVEDKYLLNLAFKSLIQETKCNLNKENIKDFELQINKLIYDRIKILPLTNPVRVTNLLV